MASHGAYLSGFLKRKPTPSHSGPQREHPAVILSHALSALYQATSQRRMRLTRCQGSVRQQDFRTRLTDDERSIGCSPRPFVAPPARHHAQRMPCAALAPGRGERTVDVDHPTTGLHDRDLVAEPTGVEGRAEHARAPPPQKSFCTSVTTSADVTIGPSYRQRGCASRGCLV